MKHSKTDDVISSIPATCEGGNECAQGSNYCEVLECQSCCPHSDMDTHGCPDCGAEYDMGAAIDAAEYHFDMER